MNDEIQQVDWWTREDVAKYLGVCLSTVIKWNIPKLKLGSFIRYRKEDVDKWVAEQFKK